MPRIRVLASWIHVRLISVLPEPGKPFWLVLSVFHPAPPHTTYPTLHAMYSIRNGWDLGLRHPQHTNSFQSFSVLRTASSLDAAFSNLLATHALYLVHLSSFLFVLPGYILKESNVSIASTPIDWNVPVACRNIVLIQTCRRSSTAWNFIHVIRRNSSLSTP